MGRGDVAVRGEEKKRASGAANWKLFALSGEKREILLIDHRGNINRLEIKTRRWGKTPIFTVPES